MAKITRTIGVMTSGGDAPGMNAAVRSVTRTALASGIRVLGFKHGYEGILHEQFQELDSRFVSNIVQRGGTVLKTARSEEFLTTRGLEKVATVLRRLNIEGLIRVNSWWQTGSECGGAHGYPLALNLQPPRILQAQMIPVGHWHSDLDRGDS